MGKIRAEDHVACRERVCVKDRRAKETLPSMLPVQWHWELSGLRAGHELELRRSLSCLFLLASPAVAKRGARFVPTHWQ